MVILISRNFCSAPCCSLVLGLAGGGGSGELVVWKFTRLLYFSKLEMVRCQNRMCFICGATVPKFI